MNQNNFYTFQKKMEAAANLAGNSSFSISRHFSIIVYVRIRLKTVAKFFQFDLPQRQLGPHALSLGEPIFISIAPKLSSLHPRGLQVECRKQSTRFDVGRELVHLGTVFMLPSWLGRGLCGRGRCVALTSKLGAVQQDKQNTYYQIVRHFCIHFMKKITST